MHLVFLDKLHERSWFAEIYLLGIILEFRMWSAWVWTAPFVFAGRYGVLVLGWGGGGGGGGRDLDDLVTNLQSEF